MGHKQSRKRGQNKVLIQHKKGETNDRGIFLGARLLKTDQSKKSS